MNDIKTYINKNKVEIVNSETGEVFLVDQITKRVADKKAFWKCYLMDFLLILGVIDSKQVEIFIHIVENTMPSNNMFLGTYDKIAKDVSVSRATIAKIMKKLQENNFIKRVQNGAWAVNPNILMKGNDNKRQILMSYYLETDKNNSITHERTPTNTVLTVGDVDKDQIKMFEEN